MATVEKRVLNQMYRFAVSIFSERPIPQNYAVREKTCFSAGAYVILICYMNNDGFVGITVDYESFLFETITSHCIHR